MFSDTPNAKRSSLKGYRDLGMARPQDKISLESHLLVFFRILKTQRVVLLKDTGTWEW